MKRPNILYLHSHDIGRYVEPYGHPVGTPNLRRLAEEGVVFRNAFCAGPTCSPSRAALLTGTYPHANGMFGLCHRGFALHDYRRHLLHTLRRHGYVSALAGTQHIAKGTRIDWKTIGYDRFLGGVEAAGIRRYEETADAALDFLRNHPDQPFFLSVGFSKPQNIKTPRIDPRFVRAPSGLPDTPEIRNQFARILTGIQLIDHHMGRVLDALDGAGLREDTLVICTTDHGINMPEKKCTLRDEGVGVMLMMRDDRLFKGGKIVEGLVSHVDVFPTLCDYLEIDHPDWLQGHSALPLVIGEAREIRDEVFSEINYHAAYEPTRSVRTRRWKYIRRFDDRTRPVLPNCDDGEAKTLWIESGWNDIEQPKEQLYDLVFDPGEKNNLAGDERHLDRLDDMRGRLETWMRDTGDPILEGEIPVPEGAEGNDPDGISPAEPTMRYH